MRNKILEIVAKYDEVSYLNIESLLKDIQKVRNVDLLEAYKIYLLSNEIINKKDDIEFDIELGIYKETSKIFLRRLEDKLDNILKGGNYG